MSRSTSQARSLFTGLAFLSPNILGFCAFTLIPLVFSLVLAFSNWDLKQHNRFHPEAHLQFIGLSNFVRLIHSNDFWRFLGNTLFFMAGLPFGIAASLGAALLLSRDDSGGSRRTRAVLVCGAVLVASCVLMAAVGAGAGAMAILLVGVLGGTLVLGTAVGGTWYRTLLYMPNFTSGVATFLVWKKLYNPETGPINQALVGPLDSLGAFVRHSPAWVSTVLGSGTCLVIAAAVAALAVWRLARTSRDAELGRGAAMLATLMLAVPLLILGPSTWPIALLAWAVAATGVWLPIIAVGGDLPRRAHCWEGTGGALVLTLFLLVAESAALGLAIVVHHLPAMAANGLHPPSWITSYSWAKPSLMLMGLWGAVGSNTMLLYLAALTNVPTELYEAADIDGAKAMTRFWNVTWPQLAPTTFFVVVMGVIGGLQSGFETAKVMTNGGPAGSTTTLSYFIYNEGFATGRLGYSSAVAVDAVRDGAGGDAVELEAGEQICQRLICHCPRPGCPPANRRNRPERRFRRTCRPALLTPNRCRRRNGGERSARWAVWRRCTWCSRYWPRSWCCRSCG